MARGDEPADLVIRGGRVLSVFTREWLETDVAIVIGANDVVNPAARHDKNSPIYGMPIIDADKAKTVMAIKRSMKPGFAGIDNELYTDPKTGMLFADAKAGLEQLAAAIKAL